METAEEERKSTVFKLEVRLKERLLLVVDAGRVAEPFVGRTFLRLETLNENTRKMEMGFNRLKLPFEGLRFSSVGFTQETIGNDVVTERNERMNESSTID